MVDSVDTEACAAGVDEACARLRAAGCGPAGQGGYLAECPRGRAHRSLCKRLSASISFLVSLVLVTSLGPLAMSSFIPAIPAIQVGFGVTLSVAQLTLSVSMWSMALSALVYGIMADRYGRRPVLLAGVATAVVGSVICAVSPDIATVILGRALQAAGASAGFVLARVIVRDVYGDDRAASVLGYVTAAMTLAPLVGPVIGGYLVDTSGWRSVFLMVAGVAAALFLVLLVRLPETRSPRVADGPAPQLSPGAFAALLTEREYLRYLLFGAFTQATFFAFIAGAPFIATQVFGLPARDYGLFFMAVPAGYFAGSLLAGRFGAQLGHERMTRYGAIGAVTACAIGFWLSLQGDFGPWRLFLPTAMLAAAQGVALPGAQAGILAAAGDRAGAGSGLFGFTQLVTSGIAAQIVGAVLMFGPSAVTAVMMSTAVLAALALAQRPGRPLTAEAG